MDSKPIVKAISKGLLFAGAIVFFFGDRALREFWHVRFVPAELCGIGGGVLLMIIGGAIRPSDSKSDDELGVEREGN